MKMFCAHCREEIVSGDRHRDIPRIGCDGPTQARFHDECIGNDPYCPCQDGFACHYVDLPGSPAMRPKERAKDEPYDHND